MITAEELRRLVDCDLESGTLIWRHRPELSKWWNETFAGKPVATSTRKGYVYVTICDVDYRLHRLIWLWAYGEWPKHTIDHIDLDKTNNRLSNLRDVSATVNAMHRRDSKLGIRRVELPDGSERWSIALKIDGKWRARRFKTYDKAREKRELMVERLLEGGHLTKAEAGWNESRHGV